MLFGYFSFRALRCCTIVFCWACGIGCWVLSLVLVKIELVRERNAFRYDPEVELLSLIPPMQSSRYRFAHRICSFGNVLRAEMSSLFDSAVVAALGAVFPSKSACASCSAGAIPVPPAMKRTWDGDCVAGDLIWKFECGPRRKRVEPSVRL